MDKKILIVISILCIYTDCIQSQDTNLARLEYVYVPQSKSDNVYSGIRFSGNYPISLNKEGSYLVPSIQYRYNNLQLNDPIIVNNITDIEEFHTIGLEVGYTFTMKNNWRFVANVGIRISSNLEASGLVGDDFRYTGAIIFIKKYGEKKDPIMSRLLLGIRYTTPASINLPLPILNYYRRFHPNWSYSLGTPKTDIKYLFDNKKHTLQAFIGLDRFYSNIQNNRTFLTSSGINTIAENVSMLTINTALGYEYYFTEHLLLFNYIGYTLSNEIRLRDDQQNNVLIINDKKTLYIRGGIKLKI